MNSPKPALVTQRAAKRLPRIPLLLLCAAYVLPGVFGRDPWRNADLTAFGQMVAIADGRTPWWAPTLGQVPADTALVTHWLGAAFIWLTSGWLDPALAARIPFALLLALTMSLVWYTSFHLARTEAAQPVPFAFGGEAAPIDYARAIADGSVLALIATLGLLQLGHETTPELGQLFATGLFSYALAAAPYRVLRSRVAILIALPLLAGSGAPSMAMAAGLAGLLVCALSRYAQVRSFTIWLAVSMALAALIANVFGAWRWRTSELASLDIPALARQWLWFLWPAWPLALLTLWRWRRQVAHRHLSVPLTTVLVALGANVAMGGSDRALLLGLPGLAVLAAFALPTLKHSAAAAIDWFSMVFFTVFAGAGWVIYASVQTGIPAQPAANVARLAPGFVAQFSIGALVLALTATLAWIWLLYWRTSRQREALWRSLVLPASGVALCWLLVMTLGLRLADYARSPRPLVALLTTRIPADVCIAAPGLSPVMVAALEYFGGWQVDARAGAVDGVCPVLLSIERGSVQAAPPKPAGWSRATVLQHPTDRDETILIYRRATSRTTSP
ncbi:MAG: hypothetical protein M3Y32_08805 [Pseudomonadota bacterium]|nr:hypothetical protein [Pseudomonadota bacterium]